MYIFIFLLALFLILIYSIQTDSNNYFFASKKCLKNCGKIFRPVYDIHGKRYSNNCEFENAKCSNPLLKLGTKPPVKKLEKAPDEQCPDVEKCKKRGLNYYQPVYDTDGKQYENDCVFSNAKCLNSKLQLDRSRSDWCNNFVIPEDIYCKPVDACDSDVEKKLPEYCKKSDDGSGGGQVCIYVNNQKPCYRRYSPEQYNNNNYVISMYQIVQNSQSPINYIPIDPKKIILM